MPRPKIDEASRRRITHACRHCKTVKQKCDGLSPCVQCVKRGRPLACEYEPRINPGGLRRRRRRSRVSGEQERESPSSQVSQAALLPIVKDSEESQRPDTRPGSIEDASELVVPRMSQVLYNSKGEPGLFIVRLYICLLMRLEVYLGDGAALSFLQNIQQLIVEQSEPTSPATDITYQLTEDGPIVQEDALDPRSLGTHQELKALADVYLTSVRHSPSLFQEQLIWRRTDNKMDRPADSLIYLIKLSS